MVPRQLNASGFTGPYRPCGSSVHTPQGPDVRLPKMLTFRQGDTAARAVIGPLPKTRRRPKTGSRLRRSVCVVTAWLRRGTITEPLVPPRCRHIHTPPPHSHVPLLVVSLRRGASSPSSCPKRWRPCTSRSSSRR